MFVISELARYQVMKPFFMRSVLLFWWTSLWQFLREQELFLLQRLSRSPEIFGGVFGGRGIAACVLDVLS